MIIAIETCMKAPTFAMRFIPAVAWAYGTIAHFRRAFRHQMVGSCVANMSMDSTSNCRCACVSVTAVGAREKVEAFAIGEETLWAVAQPVEGGFALLVLPLDNPDAQPGRILFADDTEVIGTDDALYQGGALWVSQSVRTDGKVGMRIARIDPEKQKMETVVLSAADSVVPLSSGVLAYNASTEEGYQVCLLDLASGETMRLRTGSAPWDVIATESGFALDNRLQQGEPRTVVWITMAGETLGSTALDKTLEPCSGAMGDDLVYVSATKPGEITFVPCAQEKD